MANRFIVFADSVTNPSRLSLGYEIPQHDGLVTVERTFTAPEPQPDGTIKDSCVLSMQENGSIGWRPKGTNGPFELAQPAPGFYLYAPGVRLHGDLKLPVIPLARFPEFVL